MNYIDFKENVCGICEYRDDEQCEMSDNDIDNCVFAFHPIDATEGYLHLGRYGSYSFDGRCDAVHPATPGEKGYHCPYCHKDVNPDGDA